MAEIISGKLQGSPSDNGPTYHNDSINIMSKQNFIFEQPFEAFNDLELCDLLTLAPELGQIK
jgi:hypothetical protein